MIRSKIGLSAKSEILVVTIFLSLLIFLFIDNLNLYKLLNLTIEVDNKNINTVQDDQPIVNETFYHDFSNYYYYNKLSNNEQNVFNILYEGIANKDDYIVIPKDGLSISKMDQMIYMLHFDCPEFFYLSSRSRYKQNNKKVTVFYPQYNYDEETIAEMQQEIDNFVFNYCQDKINLSSYEKEKSIHDFLAENTVYNLQTENNGNLYGCLIEGKASCKGYSAAFTYLARKLDLKSGQMIGHVTEDGIQIGHSWNIVELDKKEYYVDVTWDDIDDEENFPGIKYLYSFFNIPYSKLILTHDINENISKLGNVQKNNDDTYYLYKNNNVLVSRYEDAVDLIEAGIQDVYNGKLDYILIQCDNKSLYNEVCNKISEIIKIEIELYDLDFVSCKISNIDKSNIIVLNSFVRKGANLDSNTESSNIYD